MIIKSFALLQLEIQNFIFTFVKDLFRQVVLRHVFRLFSGICESRVLKVAKISSHIAV